MVYNKEGAPPMYCREGTSRRPPAPLHQSDSSSEPYAASPPSPVAAFAGAAFGVGTETPAACASCNRFSRSCAKTRRLSTACPDKMPPAAAAAAGAA